MNENIELLEIDEYPVPIRRNIIVTGIMREVQKRTFAVHGKCAFVVFSGEAGVGKTTTAREMVKALERKFSSSNPHAFRGIHFEVGRLRTGQGNEVKRMLRSVYAATGLRLDEGVYDRYPPEEIAAELIEYLRSRRIAMIFIDEAGLLSLEAIGGLVTLLDVAHNREHYMTIVLIGMDDLPTKLRRRPQIKRRVFEWCTFTPLELKTTIKFLKAIHPYFAELNENEDEDAAQFEFVHEITSGLPGFISSFIERFDSRWRAVGEQRVDIFFLQGVHVLTQLNMEKAVQLARGGRELSVSDNKGGSDSAEETVPR